MAACLGENGAAELFLFGHFEKGIQEPLDSNFDQREKKLVFIYIYIYIYVWIVLCWKVYTFTMDAL